MRVTRPSFGVFRWFRRSSFLTAVFVLGTAAAAAKCVEPARRSILQSFLDDPRQMLADYPNGGNAMKWWTAGLTASSAAARTAIAQLLPGANAGQRAAIALAFAYVYLSCRDNDPTLAREVAQFANAVNDRAFLRIYNSSLIEDESPDLPATEDDDQRQANKLGFGKLTTSNLKNPTKPIPLPGEAWFDK